MMLGKHSHFERLGYEYKSPISQSKILLTFILRPYLYLCPSLTLVHNRSASWAVGYSTRIVCLIIFREEACFMEILLIYVIYIFARHHFLIRLLILDYHNFIKVRRSFCPVKDFKNDTWYSLVSPFICSLDRTSPARYVEILISAN
jgi:hypothetical protein